MVSLGEDLRADEDIGVRGALEQLFEPAPPAYGVAIHAQDAGLRKLFCERNLDALGPASEGLQIGVTAFGTGARNPFRQPAMMATQLPSRQMNDHVRRTAFAAFDPAASRAGEGRRVSATIEKYQRLLSARDSCRQRLEKRSGEPLLGRMRPSIDQAYRRQYRPVDGAPGEGDELVLARVDVMKALQGRRRRAQDGRRAGDVCPRDCEIA